MFTIACCFVVGLGLGLVSRYAHVFLLLSIVVVTLPLAKGGHGGWVLRRPRKKNGRPGWDVTGYTGSATLRQLAKHSRRELTIDDLRMSASVLRASVKVMIKLVGRNVPTGNWTRDLLMVSQCASTRKMQDRKTAITFCPLFYVIRDFFPFLLCWLCRMRVTSD